MKKNPSRTIVAGFLFLVLAAAGFAQEALLSVQKADQSWYFIDGKGAIRLPGPYKAADDFSEGLGRVGVSDTQTGFVDPQGKVVFVLDAPFSQTAGFSQGLAWFVQGGRMGFVDKTGKVVIPADFTAEPGRSRQPRQPFMPVYFSDGMAPAREALTVGWHKTDGTWVSSPVQRLEASGDPLFTEFSRLGVFSEGLAAYSDGKAFGYLDVDGKTVLQPQWENARPFSEGLALVHQDTGWGFIDRKGNWAISERFSQARDFHGGRAVVALEDGWALIDATGKVVTRGWPDLSLAEDLQAPLVKNPIYVYVKNGKKGLIDSDGKLLGEANWDQIYAFVDDKAIVVRDNLYGLVDRAGKVDLEPKWAEIGYEREGLVAFSQDRKWGWLDPQGRVVVPAAWAWAGDFEKGLAPVFDGIHGGLVDRTGRIVVPLVYTEIGNLRDGYRMMKKNDKVGFLDAQGKVALAAQYDEAQDFVDGKAWVGENGLVFRIDPQGRRLDSQSWNLAGPARPGQPVLTASGGRMGFLDLQGRWAIAPVWDHALGFSDGKALVAQRVGDSVRWNYTDDKGKVLFSDKSWSPFGLFREDRAFVVISKDKNGTYNLGLIDQDGNLLASGFRVNLGGFRDGKAAVAFGDDDWGYVDKSGDRLFGNKIWQQTYPYADGLAMVVQDGKFGFIDEKGDEVIPARFDRAGLFSGGLAWVVERGVDEYIDKAGNVVWSSKTPELPVQ